MVRVTFDSSIQNQINVSGVTIETVTRFPTVIERDVTLKKLTSVILNK